MYCCHTWFPWMNGAQPKRTPHISPLLKPYAAKPIQTAHACIRYPVALAVRNSGRETTRFLEFRDSSRFAQSHTMSHTQLHLWVMSVIRVLQLSQTKRPKCCAFIARISRAAFPPCQTRKVVSILERCGKVTMRIWKWLAWKSYGQTLSSPTV